jgi:hypothetical protein
MEPSDKAMDLAVSSRQAMNSGIHLITIAKTSPTSVLAVLCTAQRRFRAAFLVVRVISVSSVTCGGPFVFARRNAM